MENLVGLDPNYAFGQQMLADFTAAIKPEGARFIQADSIPLGTTGFSSYLLAAQNSHAQVLGVLNAGADTVNTMKQVKQFGIDKHIKFAVGLLYLTDVDALPDVFAHARITTSWYWNEDKAARTWADRYTARFGGGIRPSQIQAADYSAATQWLKAVKAVGSADADKVVAYLDGRQSNDFYAHAGEWPARSSRATRDVRGRRAAKEQVKEPHAKQTVMRALGRTVEDGLRAESRSFATSLIRVTSRKA